MPHNLQCLNMRNQKGATGCPHVSPGFPPLGSFQKIPNRPVRKPCLLGLRDSCTRRFSQIRGLSAEGQNLVWKILFKTTSERVLWFLLKGWRKHILQWNCHHQDLGQESTIYVHIVTPRSLDSSSFLIIKSLFTVLIASEGTNSITQTRFFRTANLSKTSILFF